MKLNKMSKEELDILSYADLTELILIERKKGLKTPDIFKKICKLLDLTDEDYVNQVGDFYTSLTNDKRFTFIDGVWDLRDRHTSDIVYDNDEDEEDDNMDDEVVETVVSEDIDEMDDEEGIEQDDDMDDLNIISDEDLEDDE